MKPSDILYENGKYWVARCTYGTGNFRPKTEGFGVYESGVTHGVLSKEKRLAQAFRLIVGEKLKARCRHIQKRVKRSRNLNI